MAEAELAEALRTSPGARSVIIDLSGLTQVDTAALTVLLSLTRQGRKRGVVLRWKGMPAALLELAKLSSVDELLTST
jgi:ABC-type transporter Mla MlaB component